MELYQGNGGIGDYGELIPFKSVTASCKGDGGSDTSQIQSSLNSVLYHQHKGWLSLKNPLYPLKVQVDLLYQSLVSTIAFAFSPKKTPLTYQIYITPVQQPDSSYKRLDVDHKLTDQDLRVGTFCQDTPIQFIQVSYKGLVKSIKLLVIEPSIDDPFQQTGIRAIAVYQEKSPSTPEPSKNSVLPLISPLKTEPSSGDYRIERSILHRKNLEVSEQLLEQMMYQSPPEDRIRKQRPTGPTFPKSDLFNGLSTSKANNINQQSSLQAAYRELRDHQILLEHKLQSAKETGDSEEFSDLQRLLYKVQFDQLQIKPLLQTNTMLSSSDKKPTESQYVGHYLSLSNTKRNKERL